MADETRIQIEFSRTDPDFGLFRDSLFLTPQENETLTPEQIETLKNDRFNNWRSYMIESRNVTPPDPIDTIVSIDQQIEALQGERSSVVQDVALQQDVAIEQVEQQVEVAKTAQEAGE